MKKYTLGLSMLFIICGLSSCSLVTGIFKAGAWTGIIAVVVVLVIIIAIAAAFRRKG